MIYFCGIGNDAMFCVLIIFTDVVFIDSFSTLARDVSCNWDLDFSPVNNFYKSFLLFIRAFVIEPEQLLVSFPFGLEIAWLCLHSMIWFSSPGQTLFFFQFV